MNTARKTLRGEPTLATSQEPTRFLYLPGGKKTLVTESHFTVERPASEPRRVRRRMLHALITGRKAGRRARNPRFGL